MLTRYVDLMIAQLRKRAATTGSTGGGDGIVDLVSWYNFATFDIIGDLAFGEPFGCLRDGIWHRWIRNIFASLKAANYVRAARRFPSPLKEMLYMFLPRDLIESREYQFQFARDRARTRMAQGSGREDFSKCTSC